MSKKLDPKEVELFLLDNLDFFESRESLVGELKFKHSSSTASSLLERQVLKLRDEHKNLIDLLTSFIDTASINEDLFNKSKDLTLKILESNSKREIVKTVEKSFSNDFNVDKCLLKFYKNKDIDKIEKETGLSLHKGAIHCGSFSSEKADILFGDIKIESMVIAVIILEKEPTVTKSLGDTFFTVSNILKCNSSEN